MNMNPTLFKSCCKKSYFSTLSVLTFFVLVTSNALRAQNDSAAMKFSKSIVAEDLKKHLVVLASDEYEGRETGEKGQKMAAAYIMKHFKDCNIPGLKNLKEGYYQEFPLQVYQPQELQITINGKSFQPKKDFFSFSSILYDTTISINNLLFSGYGINTTGYTDYKTDLKKAKNERNLIILANEPLDKNGNSLITGEKKLSEWSTGFRKKFTEAQQQNINILFVVEDNIEEAYKKSEHKITTTKMKIADPQSKTLFSTPFTIFISREMASLLFGSDKKINNLEEQISKKGKSINKTLSAEIKLGIKQAVNRLSSENVLGYVEGTDLKDELIVVTAHYDHLGKHDGLVFNGADDDGSGTVAVMEIAETFSKAKQEGFAPRRSVLFMTVSGEEKGLLGSEYYTENPVFPLKNTVANLNIDMIGRIDDNHKGDGNYIYLIGSDKLSTDLHLLNEEANKKFCNLKLDYTYNADNDPNRFYYRSDHYNFAKNKVPVIFYFNGVHEDYHRETDDVEKIDFNKMEKISRLVFFTAWELANRTERIKLKE